MPAYGYTAGDMHYTPGLFPTHTPPPRIDNESQWEQWRAYRQRCTTINRERTTAALIAHLRNGGAVREFDGARTVVWSVAKMQAVFIGQTAESIARHLVKRSFGFGYDLELIGV